MSGDDAEGGALEPWRVAVVKAFWRKHKRLPTDMLTHPDWAVRMEAARVLAAFTGIAEMPVLLGGPHVVALLPSPGRDPTVSIALDLAGEELMRQERLRAEGARKGAAESNITRRERQAELDALALKLAAEAVQRNPNLSERAIAGNVARRAPAADAGLGNAQAVRRRLQRLKRKQI